jgi:hypothetical protein
MSNTKAMVHGLNFIKEDNMDIARASIAWELVNNNVKGLPTKEPTEPRGMEMQCSVMQ